MKTVASAYGQRKSTESPQREGGRYSSIAAVRELNKIRKRQGLSLQDIATAVGRKRHAVWKWLNGTSRPEVPIRIEIESVYGIKTVRWITRDEAKMLRLRLADIRKREKRRGRLTKPQRALQKALQDELGMSSKA